MPNDLCTRCGHREDEHMCGNAQCLHTYSSGADCDCIKFLSPKVEIEL